MGPEETIGLKEPANENTMLQKQMFPRLRPHETFVSEAKFASREAKMFLNFFRNTLLPQLFLRLRAKETFAGNIVSSNVDAFTPRFKKLLCIHSPSYLFFLSCFPGHFRTTTAKACRYQRRVSHKRRGTK